MIKFFRHIRQNLIMDNKTSKYMKYAIGEIILVVFGILIALSINNWNEDRIKKQAELKFYENIKHQLSDDASNIKGQIRYNSKYYEQFEYAINIIENEDRTKMDTLARIALNLSNYSDFDRQGNIYETMVNSGNIKLLTNEEIIDKIRRLEETYIYANRMENIHLDAVLESVVPKLVTTIKFYDFEVKESEELYGYGLQNLIMLSLRIMDEKVEIYERAINEIDAITKLIDSEIKEGS